MMALSSSKKGLIGLSLAATMLPLIGLNILVLSNRLTARIDNASLYNVTHFPSGAAVNCAYHIKCY